MLDLALHPRSQAFQSIRLRSASGRCSPEEAQEMRHQDYPAFPPDANLANARKNIDLDKPSTLALSLPQVYIVSPDHPSIHLVTDAGLRTSLRDLIHYSWAQQSESNDFLVFKRFGSNLENSGADTNPFALAIIAEEQTYLRATSAFRQESKLSPLGDLEILFLTSA